MKIIKNKSFIVKSSAHPGLTARTEILSDAKQWVSEQPDSDVFSIWEFVGSNPQNQGHYTCVQTENVGYRIKLSGDIGGF